MFGVIGRTYPGRSSLLTLLPSLTPQGNDCAAATRAVRVLPRGLRHVSASDQHPGRDLVSQGQTKPQRNSLERAIAFVSHLV